MVETWVLWVPVVATAIGAVIGFAANLATTIVAARMQERREREAAKNRDLDEALDALKHIGRDLQREVVFPGLPSLRMVRPVHEFAYEVARRAYRLMRSIAH